jgi:hypothetical protein
MLEGRYRNPGCNYSIWDSILYEKIRFEPNITTMLLNCTCNEVEMADSSIKLVKGWQLTTQSFHVVKAKFLPTVRVIRFLHRLLAQNTERAERPNRSMTKRLDRRRQT